VATERHDEKMVKFCAIVGCACVLLVVTAAAQASREGNPAAARAFIAGLNTPTRIPAFRLLAPAVKFRTLTNPWVRYARSGRRRLIGSVFGRNCALEVVRQTASPREVRTEVQERRDERHRCVGGHLGTRVVFVFRFNDHEQILALTVRNA
jgi:uncharacterized membrane protein YcfT